MSAMHRDVAIIGAGPVGIFTVFTLGQVGLTSIVIDALEEAGGQCAALYPDKPIYDIPSRSSLSAATLIEDLLAQAKPYAPTFLCGRQVMEIGGQGRGFELKLACGERIRVGAVIVAAGAGMFKPMRPPIAEIERYEGTSVFYAVTSPERFRGKRIVIAGGGDSAADWAVFLADLAEHVTLIHRRPNFRAAPATMSQIERLRDCEKISLIAPATLSALEGKGSQVSAVLIEDASRNVTACPADVLLCFFGLSKDLSSISSWEVDTTRDGIPIDPATCATCRPGIFAVGDIAHYPGKQKLILVGFAEAAVAAHHARAYLKPDEAFHFAYSTSKGKPGLAACP